MIGLPGSGKSTLANFLLENSGGVDSSCPGEGELIEDELSHLGEWKPSKDESSRPCEWKPSKDELSRPCEWNSRLHRQSVPSHTNSHLRNLVRGGGLRLCSPEFHSAGNHRQARLISTDRIRAQLFGDEATQGSWLKIWLEVRSQFQQAATSNLDFTIYDATNAVRKQRRAAIALARKCGFTHITGIWVNPPLEICLERNRQRSRQVPEEVIHRMARRLYGAPPSISEGLDEVVTIS